MKKCLWDEYICLLEEEIYKLVEYEVHCHLSSKGEKDLHHMIENLKHTKEHMAQMGEHSTMGDGEHKSYFGSV